jgi:hypothetical protein
LSEFIKLAQKKSVPLRINYIFKKLIFRRRIAGGVLGEEGPGPGITSLIHCVTVDKLIALSEPVSSTIPKAWCALGDRCGAQSSIPIIY